MSTAARIDELRKKFEENPRRYFAPLANELRKDGNLTEAIALCREFLPKQPEHMSGFIVFGQALYEAGELSEARTVFEQALALDPENLKALRHLGDIAKHDGDTAAARRWYERVLEADPRNDDIAAQLTTLVTPAFSAPVVPERPLNAEPTFSLPTHTPSFTPAFSRTPLGLGAIPTPDAALRAIDFDEVNARLREPEAAAAEPVIPEPVVDLAAPQAETELLDLDAVEALGAELSTESAATPAEDLDEAHDHVGVASSDDDPFAFDAAGNSYAVGTQSLGDDAAAAVEADFEEGLIAPEWPDTSELVARVVTPRTVTPAFIASLTPDAVSAFGVEPDDDVSLAAPEPEPDLSEPEWIESTSRASSEELPWLMPEAEESDSDIALLTPDREVESELEPELQMVAEPFAIEEPAAELENVEPIESFEPERTEASFADVMPEEPSPAFVTETMGELLVAQGFTSRAIAVYEELVRRRPYDPVLTSRLAELHEQLVDASSTAAASEGAVTTGVDDVVEEPIEAEQTTDQATEHEAEQHAADSSDDAAPPATPQLTAKERFARLAARRVPRRTPPRASTVIESPSHALSSLFGSETADGDDLAARALADAFAPLDESPNFGSDDSFEQAMLQTPSRSATPMRSATPLVSSAVPDSAAGPFSFDRFFPDPATGSTRSDAGESQLPPSTSRATPTAPADAAPPSTSEDLAQFSAWLKGLGNS